MTDRNRPKPTYPIESVDNALKLLLMFGDGQPVRVAEASERMGVARSTAHRLLAMLQYHGFVQQNHDTRAYVAGPALMLAGLKVVGNIDIRRRARPHLKALREATGETVHLALRQGTEILFLDAAESEKAVRVASRVGSSMPAHCTSVGKALLADLSDDVIVEMYPDEELPSLTARSISSRSELLEQLGQIRECGFASSRGEAEPEIGSVGLSIPNPLGIAEAALSVSAPTERLNGETEEILVKHARLAVEAISESFA